MRRRIAVQTTVVLLAVLAGMFLAELRTPGRATAQAPGKLKMQASWPSASTFMDNFRMYAERVKSYDFAANYYWKKR
ncbi:MAG: hypothetical protein ACREF4_02060 [Gammaproteobacteria bacterium]